MKVTNDQFESFYNKVRAKYGESKINPDTSMMFYDKLFDMDGHEFVESTTELLGTRQFIFGWKDIVQTRNRLFGTDTAASELMDKWEAVKPDDGNISNNAAFSQFMSDVRAEIKMNKKKPGYKSLYWLDSAADKFIEIWGRTVAKRIVKTFDHDVYYDFRVLVVDKLNIFETSGRK